MTSQKPHRELAGCSFPAQPQARTSSCSHPVPHLPALAMPGGSLTPPVPHPPCPPSTEQCQHPRFTSCAAPPWARGCCVCPPSHKCSWGSRGTRPRWQRPSPCSPPAPSPPCCLQHPVQMISRAHPTLAAGVCTARASEGCLSGGVSFLYELVL